MELFQAEHQLELFFFTSTPSQQPHGFKNMTTVFPSWLWKTTLYENLSYQHSASNAVSAGQASFIRNPLLSFILL